MEGLDKDGRVRDRSWSASRVLLQNVGALMEDLRSLTNKIDKENVPEINFKEIRVYVAARGRDVIDVDEIRAKHELAGHLADFIVNIVKYYDISVKTRPLRNAFEEAKEELERLETERDREKSIYESHVADLEKCVLEMEKAKKEAHDAAETHRKAKIRMELSERLVAVLMEHKELENLCLSMNDMCEEWEDWVKSNAPEEENAIPIEIEKSKLSYVVFEFH
eukprot:g6627.t1